MLPLVPMGLKSVFCMPWLFFNYEYFWPRVFLEITNPTEKLEDIDMLEKLK